MDIYNQLSNYLRTVPSLANGYDQVVAPFRGSFEQDKKRFFGISSDERLIYYREHYLDDYLAITDKGIYKLCLYTLFGIIKLGSEKFNCTFQQISKVEYSESMDGFYFYVNSENAFFISRVDFFSKKIDSKYRFEFADILDKAAKSLLNNVDIFQHYFDKGLALMKDEQYQDAMDSLDNAMNNLSEEDQNSFVGAGILVKKTKCLMSLGKEQEAKDTLMVAKNICAIHSGEVEKEMLSEIYSYLAHMTYNAIDAHNYLCQSYALVPDSEAKREVITDLNELHESDYFINWFISDDNLSERRVIVVMADGSIPLQSTSLLYLEKKVIKSLRLEFPIGHPVDGMLYLVHPARNKYYIPAMEYEEAVFIEKVNEYCYLLQCLGAKEIKVHKILGKSLGEMSSSKVNGNVTLGHKAIGLNVDSDLKENHTKSSDNSYEFSRTMAFTPSGNPFVPNDLNWLAIEPRWKRLVDNRLTGSLTYFTEEISTSENRILSEDEELSVKAEIGNLVSKFKGQINIKDNLFSSARQTTTWRIEANF